MWFISSTKNGGFPSPHHKGKIAQNFQVQGPSNLLQHWWLFPQINAWNVTTFFLQFSSTTKGYCTTKGWGSLVRLTSQQVSNSTKKLLPHRARFSEPWVPEVQIEPSTRKRASFRSPSWNLSHLNRDKTHCFSAHISVTDSVSSLRKGIFPLVKSN